MLAVGTAVTALQSRRVQTRFLLHIFKLSDDQPLTWAFERTCPAFVGTLTACTACRNKIAKHVDRLPSDASCSAI